MTRTTPLRLMILHLAHIFFTEDLTFKIPPLASVDGGARVYITSFRDVQFSLGLDRRGKTTW